MGCHRTIIAHLRQYTVRQLLAEFNAPLVEAEDVPDHALHKYLMLVHRDEAAECPWGEFLEEDGVGRPVALEDFKRRKLLYLLFALARSPEFSDDFIPQSCPSSAPLSAQRSLKAVSCDGLRQGCGLSPERENRRG